MSSSSIGPGDDVEAWCTRCKMNLEHRIIAVVGRDVRRVHCLTCGSDHNFYPPKGKAASDKTPSAGKTTAGTKTPKIQERIATKAHNEWAVFMKEMPEGTVPKPYRISDPYEVAEYILHPMFGTGRVLEVVGREKINVVFEEGRKVLIFNKKKT